MIDDALYDAFGQRQVSITCTPAQPVPRGDGSGAAVLAAPGYAARTFTSVGGRGPWCRSAPSRITSRPATSLAVNHQSQFPSVTMSFNLAPGVSLGRRGDDDRGRRRGEMGMPSTHPGEFPGHRAGVPGVAGQRAAADPGGAGDGLYRAGRAVRKLHPPGHDPVHAAVGGGGRAAGDAVSRRPS